MYNIETLEGYSRKGTLVNVRFKINLDTTLVNDYNEEYQHSYIFTWIRYNEGIWTVEQKYIHESYPFNEYEKITNNELIENFVNSNLFKKVKKSMKI